MKPYKLKRRMDEQRKKNPTKALRTQQLSAITRKVALDDFKNGQRGMWMWGQHEPVDIFGVSFYHRTKDHFDNLTYGELEQYFPLYERCLAKLKKEKEKADFMQKTYIPLEEDLFNIT